jgi:hypothetical protein
VLLGGRATSDRNDRRQARPLLRGGNDEQSKLLDRRDGRCIVSISPETQTGRLRRKTDSLLNSVAETAWATCAAEGACALWHAIRLG